MGFLDVLLNAVGLGAVESTLDSLGMTQHGRDQYVSQANQRELLAIQNRYNQENFDRQFAAENQEFDRRYNQYQSPQALVRQYSEAGLNPSVVLSSGQSGFGQIGSAVNPSPVSVPSLSSPSPMLISQRDSNDYIDALSRMKLNDAQKDEIYALLKGKLREQDDTHKWQSVLSAQKAFEFELDKKYGDNKRAQEIANLAQEGLVLYMQGQESAANAKFLKAKEMLADDEHKFNQVKYPKYNLYLDAIMQAIKSETSRNYSEASYSTSLANTENALRGFRLQLIDNEVTLSDKTLQSNIDKIVNEGKKSAFLPDIAEQELEMAKKENNMYYAKAILSIITDAVGTAMYARTGGRVATAMEIRNTIAERVQQYKESHPVTERVVDTFGKNGRQTGRTHSYSRSRPSKK